MDNVLLFQAGADVNVLNDVGDTPLHRAAYTGRLVSNICVLYVYINKYVPAYIK